MKKLFFAFLLLLMPVAAQANIDIVPKRVILEPRDRGGEITIFNFSDTAGTYRVTLSNYTQRENGSLSKIDRPLSPFFDPEEHVRMTPRQFLLPANGRQKVRLSIRKPADLPEGEYRFYVTSERVSDQIEIDSDEPGAYIPVVARVTLSIPAIIKHGRVTSSAQLSNIRFISNTRSSSGKPELHLTINRTGNASALGILSATWIPKGDKDKQKQIGYKSNANVYPERDSREVVLELSDLPQGAGYIRLQYLDSYNVGDVFDEVMLEK